MFVCIFAKCVYEYVSVCVCVWSSFFKKEKITAFCIQGLTKKCLYYFAVRLLPLLNCPQTIYLQNLYITYEVFVFRVISVRVTYLSNFGFQYHIILVLLIRQHIKNILWVLLFCMQVSLFLKRLFLIILFFSLKGFVTSNWNV